MKKLTLNRVKCNILGLLLYFIGLILGIAITFYFAKMIYFQLNYRFILAFIGIIFSHEFTHYIAYRFLLSVSATNLTFTSDRRYDIPYCKTIEFVNSNGLILVMILPLLLTSMLVIILSIVTGNLTFALLLGISFAMSSADLYMAVQVLSEGKEAWKSLDNEFGFINN